MRSQDPPNNEPLHEWRKGNVVAAVAPRYEEALRQDLVDNFPLTESRLSSGEVKLLRGRRRHYSFRPNGMDTRVVVRKYARGGVISWLGELFVGSRRPFSEAESVLSAQRAGVNVPQIVSVRAERVFLCFYRYTIVSEEISEAVKLRDFLTTHPVGAKKHLLPLLAEELRKLHLAGIYHGDLTLDNILVQGEGEGAKVFVIDFDKAIDAGRSDAILAERNLRRFYRSIAKWEEGKGLLTKCDRMRFLSVYCRDARTTRSWAKSCDAGLWLHKVRWALCGAWK